MEVRHRCPNSEGSLEPASMACHAMPALLRKGFLSQVDARHFFHLFVWCFCFFFFSIQCLFAFRLMFSVPFLIFLFSSFGSALNYPAWDDGEFTHFAFLLTFLLLFNEKLRSIVFDGVFNSHLKHII